MAEKAEKKTRRVIPVEEKIAAAEKSIKFYEKRIKGLKTKIENYKAGDALKNKRKEARDKINNMTMEELEKLGL